MISLRPYQQEAVDAVFREWEEKTSTLIVNPTGTGKTVTFSEIIRRSHPKRAIVLVHRSELLFQAKQKLSDIGIDSDVEMADFRSSTSNWDQRQVVIATVQTLASGRNGGRKMKFNPQDFGLLIADEAHHYTSPQFKSAIDYFRQNPELKVLGVTATPDRADEQALGQVFESVAYDYELLDAIKDGWLVDIDQQMVHIEGLDFSHIRTTAGDLNGADLSEEMEKDKNLLGIADAIIRIVGDRKTIVFTVSVLQAEKLSDILNDHRSDMSQFVSGKTEKETRLKILSDFKHDKTQIICNCGVLSEGFDDPGVKVIVQARPTKSRCLYSQQIGRATRPLPGLVDGLASPEERRNAIALSEKSSCLIVDFSGNSGRHKLITTADVLGGKVSDEAIELAIKKVKEDGEPRTMSELLRESQEEIEERKRQESLRRSQVQVKAKFTTTRIDPFAIWQINPVRERGWDEGKQLSEKQIALLVKQGLSPKDLGYTRGKQVLNEMFRRMKMNYATLKQCSILGRHGYDTTNMKFNEASKLIDALAKNHWKRPA